MTTKTTVIPRKHILSHCPGPLRRQLGPEIGQARPFSTQCPPLVQTCNYEKTCKRNGKILYVITISMFFLVHELQPAADQPAVTPSTGVVDKVSRGDMPRRFWLSTAASNCAQSFPYIHEAIWRPERALGGWFPLLERRCAQRLLNGENELLGSLT